MIPKTFLKTAIAAAIFATAIPYSYAEEVKETSPKELVAELAAQKEKNAEETAALRKKLDEAYAQLQKARENRRYTIAAVSIVSFVIGCGFATFLIMKARKQGAKKR
jgi:hypothetical protein